MIIDAMDILYSDRVDGFCICSSDSDFTRLAARLRESGKQVIGMGEKAKETTAMVSACQTYKYLDLITNSEKASEKENKTLTEAEEKLKKEIVEIIESIEPEDSALSSFIGESLRKKHPEFDPRNYGCKKFLDLLKKLGFETKKEGPGTIRVHLKSQMKA